MIRNESSVARMYETERTAFISVLEITKCFVELEYVLNIIVMY